MIRNLIEIVFWCVALMVLVGLYMTAINNIETDVTAYHDEVNLELID